MLKNLLILLTITLVTLNLANLSACGQAGALYLPTDTNSREATPFGKSLPSSTTISPTLPKSSELKKP